MVEFLNTEKAYSKIVEIVSKADSKLVLISPYIGIPKPSLERPQSNFKASVWVLDP